MVFSGRWNRCLLPLLACMALLGFPACGGGGGGGGVVVVDRNTRGLGTSEVHAFVPGDGGDWLVVRFLLPPAGRFPGPPGMTRAPMVVQVATFLTPGQGFSPSPDPAQEGIAHVSFL